VAELRAEYLFAFAHLCHCSPRDVDALRYLDFIQLILDIDAYGEAMKKKETQQWQ
jgi:hypothetical protein